MLYFAEGKTKVIAGLNDGSSAVFITSKDDITAGDGAKHDVIPGKGALANETTCNVFRVLKTRGVPVAFHTQVDSTTFSAPFCEMLPYEVVVRREAHGSYLKRFPEFEKGHLFPELLVEFFLKTNGRKWKEHDLLCDDPLMHYAEGYHKIDLYAASRPMRSQEPFLVLKESEVFTHPEEWKHFPSMREIAKCAFSLLERAWQLEGGRLVDFKVEFGLTSDGILLLADAIDNDSWRVLMDDAHVDKQSYRDGEEIAAVLEKYRRVAEITGRFIDHQ